MAGSGNGNSRLRALRLSLRKTTWDPIGAIMRSTKTPKQKAQALLDLAKDVGSIKNLMHYEPIEVSRRVGLHNQIDNALALLSKGRGEEYALLTRKETYPPRCIETLPTEYSLKTWWKQQKQKGQRRASSSIRKLMGRPDLTVTQAKRLAKRLTPPGTRIRVSKQGGGGYQWKTKTLAAYPKAAVIEHEATHARQHAKLGRAMVPLYKGLPLAGMLGGVLLGTAKAAGKLKRMQHWVPSVVAAGSYIPQLAMEGHASWKARKAKSGVEAGLKSFGTYLIPPALMATTLGVQALRTKRTNRFSYALPTRKEQFNPRYIKTLDSEMRQHKVPSRTRLQWLSRTFGGRGGRPSEEIVSIATGKKATGSVYIYPYVKHAPPEVNRILEASYRTTRKALASQVRRGILTEREAKAQAAIRAWQHVKKAGYRKMPIRKGTEWRKQKYANTDAINRALMRLKYPGWRNRLLRRKRMGYALTPGTKIAKGKVAKLTIEQQAARALTEAQQFREGAELQRKTKIALKKRLPALRQVTREAEAMFGPRGVKGFLWRHKRGLGTLGGALAVAEILRRRHGEIQKERAEQHFALPVAKVGLAGRILRKRIPIHTAIGGGLLAGWGLKKSKERLKRWRASRYAIQDLGGGLLTSGPVGAFQSIRKVPFWQRVGSRAKAATARLGLGAKSVTSGAGKGALIFLGYWVTKEILEKVRKRSPNLGLPTIRADVEFAPTYEIHYANLGPGGDQFALDAVSQATSRIKNIPTPLLHQFRSKVSLTINRMAKGSLKLLLAYHLGLITAELVGRGFSRTKHKVEFQRYFMVPAAAAKLAGAKAAPGLLRKAGSMAWKGLNSPWAMLPFFIPMGGKKKQKQGLVAQQRQGRQYAFVGTGSEEYEEAKRLAAGKAKRERQVIHVRRTEEMRQAKLAQEKAAAQRARQDFVAQERRWIRRGKPGELAVHTPNKLIKDAVENVTTGPAGIPRIRKPAMIRRGGKLLWKTGKLAGLVGAGLLAKRIIDERRRVRGKGAKEYQFFPQHGIKHRLPSLSTLKGMAPKIGKLKKVWGGLSKVSGGVGTAVTAALPLMLVASMVPVPRGDKKRKAE